MKTTEQFYNRLTMFYPLIDFLLTPQKRKFIGEINTYPPGVLLEIGVGNGSHFPFYKEHQIVGIDTSSGMLERAKKHQTQNIRLLQMSGEALQFPVELFDYAVLSHVIAVVSDPEKLLVEVHRVLKPGGKVFILNHVTPHNGLQYIDKSFQWLGKLLHFRSVFHVNNLEEIARFKLVREHSAGILSYFKILIYEKVL